MPESQDRVPETPRERILAAAIDIIEKDGPRKATTRSIAALAGVNVAAINYYYRTKETLLDAALADSWVHALVHLRGILDDQSLDARAMLRAVGSFLLEGGYRYPAVTRAALFDGEGEPRQTLSQTLAGFSSEFSLNLAKRLDLTIDKAFQARVSMFIASIFFPPLVSVALPWLDSKEARNEYLATLVEDFLHALESGQKTG